MRAYREAEARASDLETAALHDLLARVRRLRRRVVLPLAIAGVVVALGGMTVHVAGRWSVLGSLDDGGYYVTAFSLGAAGLLCAAPVVAPGAALYLALRARLRDAWRTAHAARGVPAEFLAENLRRFG